MTGPAEHSDRAARVPGATRQLRVGIDATPLAGRRTGVGRYLEGVLSGLRELGSPIDPVLSVFSARRATVPRADLVGARRAPLRAPARLLQALWARTDLPPVEWLTGRIDVFHATNFVLPPTRGAGVLTIHDLAYLRHADTVSQASARYRTLVPRGIGRARLVICFTEAVRTEICDAYDVDPVRVRVIPHGVDPGWARAVAPTERQLSAWGLPPRYLVAVGTVEPRKNLGMLIAAHAAARRRRVDVPPLVLIGGPGWGAPFGGVQPDPADVRMAGYLTDERLRAVVAGADALCMPSRYEGFGLPLLEALAAGRPVLASDIAAHREVGADVVQYVAMDTAAWAEAIAGLAAHGPHSSSAQRRARATGFTWRRSAQAHVQAYRDAVGG